MPETGGRGPVALTVRPWTSRLTIPLAPVDGLSVVDGRGEVPGPQFRQTNWRREWALRQALR